MAEHDQTTDVRTEDTAPLATLPETGLQRLLEDNWQLFRRHQPVGAYLPVGQLDGDCRACGGAWPCSPVLDVFAPVTETIRALGTRPTAGTSPS